MNQVAAGASPSPRSPVAPIGPLRVAFLITRSDAIGGAAVHVRDLSSWLRDQGHAPVVLVGGTGPFTEQLDHRGIEWVSLRHLRRGISFVRDPLALAEIASALRRLRPDLLSVHSAKPGFLGRVAARWASVPAIFTAHGWSFTEGVPAVERRVYRTLERSVGRLAAATIAVSEFDRDLAVSEGVLPRERVRVIRNGMPDVPVGLRANPSTDPPKVLMVGRFEPQKDQDTLVRALGQIESLPWSLEMVGDGPRLEAVRGLVRELGLEDRVVFSGYSENVASRLATGQLFALASHWEGFPRSTLEAMRAGLPTVVTDAGGSAEAVDEGVTGHVVRKEEPSHLAAALAPLLRSPTLRAEMGHQARKAYEKRFTFERMVSETLEVYREVMEGGAVR